MIVTCLQLKPIRKIFRFFIALGCGVALFGNAILPVRAGSGPLIQNVVKIPTDQLDSLVLNPRTLFCRSAAVLGRPHRTGPSQQDTGNRAPTEVTIKSSRD